MWTDATLSPGRVDKEIHVAYAGRSGSHLLPFWTHLADTARRRTTLDWISTICTRTRTGLVSASGVRLAQRTQGENGYVLNVSRRWA